MIHPCFPIYIFHFYLLICCRIILLPIYIYTLIHYYFTIAFFRQSRGVPDCHTLYLSRLPAKQKPGTSSPYRVNFCEHFVNFFSALQRKNKAPFISVCRNSCSSADGKTRAPDISSGLRSAGPAVSYCLWQRLWQSRYPIRQAGSPRSAAFRCKN